MRARLVLRFTAALQALLLMATLLLPALAAATEISTDLWIYNDGDTVTVTGIDFGANEVVDLVTTDPEGTVVDSGNASTDGVGGFTYQFILNATVPGIYDVVATGQTSGLTAATQFDPPTITITFPLATAYNSASWNAACSTAGVGDMCGSAERSGTTSLTSISYSLQQGVGNFWNGASFGSGSETTFSLFAGSTTASQGWSISFPISNFPADGSYTLKIYAVQTGSGGTTNNLSRTFSIDTTPPTSTIDAPGVDPTNVDASGTVADATSGPASLDVSLYSGACPGTTLLASGSDSSFPGGAWQVQNLAGGGSSTPGTYCLRSTATDAAGNVQSPVTTRQYVVDTAPAVVSTSPADGATNVPVGSSVNMTFSEAVTLDANAIAVECPAGTVIAGSITGAATLWTFDPSSDLPSSTTCSVRVHFNKVHDVDGNDPPDELDGHYDFGFTTASANTNPVITVPASPVTEEATSSAGAVVNFVVSATDAEDNPDPTPTCDWVSGATFPIGDTVVSCSVTDSGGLGDSDTFTVRVRDTTDPSVSITTAESIGGFGWYNIASNDGSAGLTIDVTVNDSVGVTSLTCTDNLVDVGPLDPAGDSFVIDDGVHTIDCVAEDGAGNDASDSESFSVDQTAPSISADIAPAAAGTGWWNIATGAPTVTYTCGDTGSGLASCTSPYLFGEGENQSHTGYAYDNAGNSNSAGVSNIDVDLTAPSISIVTPVNGATYLLNQVVIADFACSDVTSGVASCVGTVADGAAIDTASVGFKSFGVNAADAAGNTASASSSYEVRYNVCVLYDQAKSHKAGSTIPIKLYACDANNVNVSSPGLVVQATWLYKLDNSASTSVEDSGYANPDNNFRYDTGLYTEGGYIFNLSTKSPSPALGQTTSLSKGTWKLSFRIGASTGYFVTFDIK